MQYVKYKVDSKMVVNKNSTTVVTVLLGSWIVLSMFYYNNMFNLARTGAVNTRVYRNNSEIRESTQNESIYSRHVRSYNGSENYLIDTPGCFIPNYLKTMVYAKAKNSYATCGARAVFVETISNDVITFYIDDEKMKKYSKSKDVRCCVKFVSRSTVPKKEDTKIKYSSCYPFKNGTTIKQAQEVFTVTCSSNNTKKSIYEDAYLILKKITRKNSKQNGNGTYWNVLILGMDTMSRARVYDSIPQTVKYLQQNQWLDYRGHTKVGSNTYPNIMAMLAGIEPAKAYSTCAATGMDACNELMIWSEYKRSGYFTAYGEENLLLPDTFSRYNGFRYPPTDHYTRPFFLTGESSKGNLICAKTLPSAKHLLNYAHDFANAYKHDNFFGMFWLNSYSHNLNNIPSLLDNDIVSFFKKIERTSVLNNTFVIFVSDHGIRFGKTRRSIESYYEERLPMLFVWTPLRFRIKYPEEYYNLLLNQNRLTTPYDVHATLRSILNKSNSTINIIPSAACPNCRSLFEEKSLYRTCTEAMVDEKWCSCHNLTYIHQNDTGLQKSLQLGVSYIQNRSRSIETSPCFECSGFKLKNVLRSHSYRDIISNKTYYVVAFVMAPGDIAYEAKVSADGSEYKLIQPTETISEYNIKGHCAKNPNNRAYCMCKASKCINKNILTKKYLNKVVEIYKEKMAKV